jgi:hypothetical protein
MRHQAEREPKPSDGGAPCGLSWPSALMSGHRALALKALDQRVASKPPRPPPQAHAAASPPQPAASTLSGPGPSEVVFDASKE